MNSFQVEFSYCLNTENYDKVYDKLKNYMLNLLYKSRLSLNDNLFLLFL